MPTVTKKELIDRISDKTDQKRTCVKRIVQMFLDEVIDELASGNRLEFRDFGVFEIKTRRARRAQNPRTLQPVRVPEKRTVKFKVGRLMKQRLDREVPAEDAGTPTDAQGGNDGLEAHVEAGHTRQADGSTVGTLPHGGPDRDYGIEPLGLPESNAAEAARKPRVD